MFTQIVILLSIILMSGLPYGGRPTSASAQTAPAVAREAEDVVLLRVAVAVAGAAPEINALWPGVWLEERRVLLSSATTGSILIGPAPSGYTGPIEALPLALAATKTALWRLSEEKPFVPLDFDYPLGDVRVFVSGYMPRVTHFDDPTVATSILLFHELFHAFQIASFTRPSVDFDVMLDALASHSPPPNEVEARLLEAERRLLQAAIAARSDAESIGYLREYYAQLDRRYPRVLRAGEEYLEQQEGTATYFSYLAAARVLNLSDDDVLRFLVRDLMHTYPEDSESGMDGTRNWHTYAAGAAKAQLASRFVPQWQTGIMAGATLDELLLMVVSR